MTDIQGTTAIVVACISMGISFIACIGAAFGGRAQYPPGLIKRIVALERRHAIVWSRGTDPNRWNAGSTAKTVLPI